MSKRILVVEDQPDNRQIIRDMLAGTDYEITEAEDGEHALAAVAKQRPDLILMSIQLPVMDGYEVTRLIKADPAMRCVRQCDHRRGRPHIADQSKNLISFIELLHCYRSSRRLIAVVRRDKPQLAAVHPAIGIGQFERRLDTQLHVLAEFLGGTGEGCGNPKSNFTVGYSADSWGGLACPANSRDTCRRLVSGLRNHWRNRNTDGGRTRLSCLRTRRRNRKTIGRRAHLFWHF